MIWEVQYRKVGDTQIMRDVVNVNFTRRDEVKKWFLSIKTTKHKVHLDGDWSNRFFEGDRKDIVFVNAKKITDV